jgi:hypothetical protein
MITRIIDLGSEILCTIRIDKINTMIIHINPIICLPVSNHSGIYPKPPNSLLRILGKKTKTGISKSHKVIIVGNQNADTTETNVSSNAPFPPMKLLPN